MAQTKSPPGDKQTDEGDAKLRKIETIKAQLEKLSPLIDTLPEHRARLERMQPVLERFAEAAQQLDPAKLSKEIDDFLNGQSGGQPTGAQPTAASFTAANARVLRDQIPLGFAYEHHLDWSERKLAPAKNLLRSEILTQAQKAEIEKQLAENRQVIIEDKAKLALEDCRNKLLNHSQYLAAADFVMEMLKICKEALGVNIAPLRLINRQNEEINRTLIGKLEGRLTEVRNDSQQLQAALDKARAEISTPVEESKSRSIIDESAVKTIKYFLIASVLLIVIVIGAMLFSHHRMVQVYNLQPGTQSVFPEFNHVLYLDMMTVFLLTIAILVLGLAGQLEAQGLAALIGGISGYVLGRMNSRQSGSPSSGSSDTK